MKKVLAVASGGGHWVQLLRLRKSFEGCEVVYVTTNADYAAEVTDRLLVVKDANLNEKLKLVTMFMQMFWIIVKNRPDVVITTGAAPGYAAIMFGKLFGARTMWIDSIANADELSGSGQRARRWADVWMTQWEHLACDDGPIFKGKVL